MELPRFDMTGRVALVTGSGRGIALGMAQVLAAAGCAVVIQDIEIDVAQAEAKKLRDQGARAIALGGDVTDISIAESLVNETVKQLGGLHVLINSASIQKREHWLEMSVAEMEREFRA